MPVKKQRREAGTRAYERNRPWEWYSTGPFVYIFAVLCKKIYNLAVSFVR